MELFFHRPTEAFYLRKIVREIDEEVNAVKRELDILSGDKLLLKEKRLNKILYTINKSYFFYDEFMRISAKSDGLARRLYANISKLGKAKFIVISTKYPRRLPIKEDEIYLLVVGTVVVPEVAAIVKETEKEFGREINYTVMTEEELVFRKKNNDPFIWKFLKQSKIMLVGSDEELLK